MILMWVQLEDSVTGTTVAGTVGWSPGLPSSSAC